jgi:hypothetical protein
MGLRELTQRHQEEIRLIARRNGAVGISLFGSAVRGEDRPGSDLDVLVNLAPGRTLLDVVAIKQDLEDLLHVPVDVVTERSVSPYMREEILRQAVAL